MAREHFATRRAGKMGKWEKLPKALTRGEKYDIISAHSVLKRGEKVPKTLKTEALIVDEMCDRIIETAEHIVTADGAHSLTVRKILSAMGITNRVFYNRFHNIDEVLAVVYKKTALKIRQSIPREIDNSRDFFDWVLGVVESSLIRSYEIKMRFNHYVFENDSLSDGNYEWWITEIKKLLAYAMEHDYIQAVDTDMLSYAIWCFCRGYNADAVGRGMPKDEAVRRFRYGFGFLLEGIKK